MIIEINVNNMAEIRQDEYMVDLDHVDGSISSAYAEDYAGKIPDFSHTTVEQVNEWTGAGTYHE